MKMTLEIAKLSSPSQCRFCTLLGTSKSAPGIDRPWMSTNDYSALISYGALVPGWTLLAPNKHAPNMLDAYKDPNFWDFARQAATRLSKQYGRIVAFEHGPKTSDSLTACGTGHAHLHLVPLDFDLTVVAKEFDSRKIWSSTTFGEMPIEISNEEYLFVSDSFEAEASRGVVSALKEPTSQFFRKAIAKKLGMLEFSDYRRFPMLDIVESSTLALESLVQDSYQLESIEMK